MKPKIQSMLITLALLPVFNLQLSNACAQGTAFTYQGQLNSGTNTANGRYDLTFTLFNAGTGGIQVGATITNTATVVSNGLFIVTLDYGSGIFNGTNYWLSAGVRTNGNGSFTALTPLQPILPTPYAIYASNSAVAGGVAAGSVTGSGIASSTILAGNIAAGQVVKSLNGLHDAVTLAAGANVAFTTNGNILTVSGSGGGGSGWSLTGNAGTTAGVNYVGTTDNQPLELHVNGQRAFRLEPATSVNAPNVIGGSSSTISATNATIGGGYFNIIQGNRDSTIAGGWENFIRSGADFSTIGGGGGNTNYAANATIAGGAYNTVQSFAPDSFIGGGYSNVVQSYTIDSTISGGYGNNASGNYVTIGGGGGNSSAGNSATISGGAYNLIGLSDYSIISGGISNVVTDNSKYSTIGGGKQNMIDTYDLFSTISGGLSNYIGTSISVYGGSVIAGGAFNMIQKTVVGFCTISGGFSNNISYNADYATISGGFDNTIGIGDAQNQSFSTIGGGEQNFIVSNSRDATIGGGQVNSVSGQFPTISGGQLNVASNSVAGTVAGGYKNLVNGSDYGVVSGGIANVLSASDAGVIAGGSFNQITNGSSAAIGGGNGNVVTGSFAVVPGGNHNSASGDESFAAGFHALAVYNNSFVWSDGGSSASNTAPNQFVVDASGGVFINTFGGGSMFNVGGGASFAGDINANNLTLTNNLSVPNGSITAGGSIFGASLHLTADIQATGNAVINGNVAVGGNVSAKNFITTSDRNLKDHFASVNAVEILDKVTSLPIFSWNFRGDEQARHIGPMAQDFHAVFALDGPDDKHIAVVDEGGVALAAIQGLNQRLEEQAKEKDVEIQTLEKKLDALQAVVKQLAQRSRETASSSE